MSARSRTAPSLVEPAKADGALAAAVDAFLSQPDLAVTTRPKYRQMLAVLEVELATAPVTSAAIGGVLAQRCPDAAPATWNRHLATVRSFARYCQRNGPAGHRRRHRPGPACGEARPDAQHPAGEPRAAVGTSRGRAARAHAGRLLHRRRHAPTRCCARDVEDLDVASKRARTRSKGGDTDWLFFGSAIALSLERPRACERLGDVPGVRPVLAELCFATRGVSI